MQRAQSEIGAQYPSEFARCGERKASLQQDRRVDPSDRPRRRNSASPLEDSGIPDFPPTINSPANRIAHGNLTLPGPDVPFTWTFEEPGRYLVICEVLPHFAVNGMYGWVIVK